RVESSLIDDRVDAKRRLAGGTIPDNQFTLAAADGNHSIHWHDSGLHWLTDGLSPDNTGRDFFDRISDVTFDGSLPVNGLAQSIHDTAEESLANRHLQQLASATNLVTLVDLGVVPQD